MGLQFLMVPFILMALGVTVAFVWSLAIWLRDHRLRFRGFRIVFSKRSAPRGFEVKLANGVKSVTLVKKSEQERD